MDPITHGLIGAAIAAVSGHPAQMSDPVFLGCTIGAMLPDLDIITHYKGRLNYLMKHRGASHSIFAITGIALALSAVLSVLNPQTSAISIFLWTIAGTLSHSVVDILNSFGAELLWPFVRKKLTVNMIMLTDPVILLIFLGAFVFSLHKPGLAVSVNLSAFSLSALYLLIREHSRRVVRNKLAEIYHLTEKNKIQIFPAMYRPFSWNFLLIEESMLRFGTFRFGKPTVQRVWTQINPANPLIDAAKDGALAEVFRNLSSFCHISEVNDQDEQKEVEFLDLRYWTKDNFLYSGRVSFENGCISEETIYLSPNQKGIQLGY